MNFWTFEIKLLDQKLCAQKDDFRKFGHIANNIIQFLIATLISYYASHIYSYYYCYNNVYSYGF